MQSSAISNIKPSDRLNVLVFGAGAIGTYFGGSLVLAGHNVVFVEQPKMVSELREHGLRLDLTIDERRKTKDAFVIEPRSFVIEPSLEEALKFGPFDVALFALKSFDTAAAHSSLFKHTCTDAALVQRPRQGNGVGLARNPALCAKRDAGLVVRFPGARGGPDALYRRIDR